MAFRPVSFKTFAAAITIHGATDVSLNRLRFRVRENRFFFFLLHFQSKSHPNVLSFYLGISAHRISGMGGHGRVISIPAGSASRGVGSRII